MIEFQEIPSYLPHVRFSRDFSFSRHTTVGIGGTAPVALYPKNEKELTDTLEQRLSEQKYVHVLGGNVEKQSVISVVVDGIHPYDMASFLNKYGIAVRSGNHCAQPMLRRLGYDSVIRFSPAFYNTKEEIEVIGDRMEKIISFLKKW